MAALSKKAPCRPLLLFAFTMVMFIAMAMPAQATKKRKKEEKKDEKPRYMVTGRDPQAFPDAAALFAIPLQGALDDATARTILDDLEKSFKEGNPWSSNLWVKLDRLRATRRSEGLITELRNIAQKMLIRESKSLSSKITSAKEAFKKGNKQYESGKFDNAIKSYRLALKEHPAFWDAWNNMALAELHSDNDLIALFLFSALTRNNPKYKGASINLSVCLERLGHNAAAFDMAAGVAKERSQLPMAQYNMAWFENSRGKYGSAKTYLSNTFASVSDYPLAKWLRTINTMEAGRGIGADEMKNLPSGEQTQGIPNVVSRPVKVAAADAYSGNSVVEKIPKGTRLVISEKVEDWNAFYWTVDNVKHRLWVKNAALGNEKAGEFQKTISDFTIPKDLDLMIVYTSKRREDAEKAAKRLRKHGFKVSLNQTSTSGSSKYSGKVFSEKKYASLANHIIEIVSDIAPMKWERGSKHWKSFAKNKIRLWIID